MPILNTNRQPLPPFFEKMRKLFSSGIIIKQLGDEKIKVIDTNNDQQFRHLATNFMLDKYSRLYNSAGYAGTIAGMGYDQTSAMVPQRNTIFRDYENMDQDPIISCLAGDTRVCTLKGFEKIEDLVKEYKHNEFFEVWAWDKDKCQYTIGQAHHPRKTGTKKVIEILLDNDSVLKCTEDHRILLKDGTYKQAKDLIIGESLMPYVTSFKPKINFRLFNIKNYIRKTINDNKRYSIKNIFYNIEFLVERFNNILNFKINRKVVKIIDNNEIIDVYDLTVDHFENFCLENGIIVSNSALDIYADECVGESTIIPLLDGRKITIKQLYDNKEENFWIYSCDEDGHFIPAKCERVAYNGKKEMYKLYLDDGTEIISSEKHLWLLNGKMKFTKDLEFGDSLKIFNTKLSNNKQMLDYEMLSEDGRKYDYTHRLVARKNKQLLKQKVKYKSFIIHHASFDKLNNSPEYLKILSWYEHNLEHAKFNKALWANPENNKLMIERIKQRQGLYWTKENRDKVGIRQSKLLKEFYKGLSKDERCKLNARNGKDNGMFGNGIKVSGKNNGRYNKNYNYIDDIDLNLYERCLLEGYTRKQLSIKFNLLYKNVIKLNSYFCKKYNVKQFKQVIAKNRLNSKVSSLNLDFAIIKEKLEKLRTFNDPTRHISKVSKELNLKNKEILNAIKQNGYKSFSDYYANINHRIIKIEKIGKFDAYDLVNTGDSHIYAIEAKDGSKILCHNCTVHSEYGNVLTISSDNEEIKDILHNLFYDIMNIEFNIWPWVRNLVKYGDFFLKLEMSEKYGIVNCLPLSSYEVRRAEMFDPLQPNLVKFIITPFLTGNTKQGELEAYEVAHFRLLSDTNWLPYGKSMLEGGRKVWKQLQLMEDAMLIHRIMRAPEKRVFKIDIGNIPPSEVDNYMEKIISKMKKVPYVDPNTGDYNLKFNMQNLIEDFYLPIRGGDSGTSIETAAALDFDSITDIEYLRNKLMASLRVPKAFLGYEEGLGSKSTLAGQDVRFARTIERIQRVIISELTKIATIHLYSQGIDDAALVDFQLSMTSPSALYEQEKIELWKSRIEVAGDAVDKKLLSKDMIYRTLFHFSENEIEKERQGVLDDQKDLFRYSQLEGEGNDPIKTGMSFGTRHDLMLLNKSNTHGREIDLGDTNFLKGKTAYQNTDGTKKEYAEYDNSEDPRKISDARKDINTRYDLYNRNSPMAISKTMKQHGGALSRENKQLLKKIYDKKKILSESIGTDKIIKDTDEGMLKEDNLNLNI